MSKPEQPQNNQPMDAPQDEQVNNPEVVDAEQQVEVDATSESQLIARIGELEAELAGTKDEAQSRKDAALRAAAETENVRRRAAQEVQKARDFALEKFAAELLPVVDNLERALQSIGDANEQTQAIVEGIEITQKSFLNTLSKFGIEVVDPQEQPFNPDHHEAMGMQENAEYPANTVIAVMQKGYLLNGRLLRPAMVMVSRAPTSGVNTTA